MRRVGVVLRGGPMDGWVVAEDAPALRPDWDRTIPRHRRGLRDILFGRPVPSIWRGRYVLTDASPVRVAEWQDEGTELPAFRSLRRTLWLWVLIIGTILALRYAANGGALLGFSIGQVFLELLADGARFKQSVQQEAEKAADAAAQSMSTRLSAGLQKAGRSLASTGKAMTMSLTAPIVGLGAAIFKVGTDFDTTMRQIVALTDTTSSEIGGVKDAILSLAGEVGKTPKELADGFYFLASAGFSTAEAMTVLQTTAKASAAGLGTTADISRIVGAAINAFGKDNLTAADAVDQLLRAVKDGTAEAPDFANALGQVLATAAQMGSTFADTSAAIAAMTLKGIDADTAATNLNQIFVSLLKPTSQAEDALKGLGLSSEGLRKELKEKGLLALLQTLTDKFEGNDTAAAAVFGNVRALRGVLALTGGDAAQTAKVFNDVANGVTNLSDAFAATEGPGRKANQAMARIQVALIKLSDDVLPVVADLMDKVSSAVSAIASAFTSLPQPVRSATVKILALLAALGPVLFITGKITSGVGQMIGMFGKLSTTAATLGPKIAAGLAGAWRAAAASSVLGPAISAAASAAQTLYLKALYLGEALSGAVSGAWAKVAGSRIVIAAANSAGVAAGLAFVAGVTGIAVASGLAAGIRDLWNGLTGIDLTLAPTLEEQIARNKEKYDAEQAALGKMTPAFLNSGKVAGIAVGRGVEAGVKAETPGVGSALAYYGEAVKRFGLNAGKLAHEAGNRTGAAVAQGITEARNKPLDAFEQMLEMLKHPIAATAEVARLAGELFGKDLVKGLKSGDPAIRAQARAVKQGIIDRLNELNVRTGIISKATAKAVADGLKSKDPDIRAAAQHIQDIIDGKFDAIPAHAATAGSKAGTAFLRALTIKLGNAKIPGLAVQFMNKTIPIFGEGGHLGAGEAAIVGDKGRPELFVPDVAGQVYPDLPAATPTPVASGSVSVGPINLYGVGSDVSPAAGMRLSHQILDAVAGGLREQQARSVR